jgi:hypothetical protein
MGYLDTTININDAINPRFLARLDSNFNFKWRTVFNASETKDIYSKKRISDYGIVLVGFKHDNNTVFPVGWIAKIDSSGNKLWEHFYTHDNNTITYNYFSDFQETFDHGFIVCGTTWGGQSQDSWIVKLDSNGCLDTTCGFNTGTVEVFYPNSSLDIFPNPSTDKVTINYYLTQGKTGKLSVINMLGEKMKDQLLSQGSKQMEINISQWAKGIYMCVVETAGVIYYGKIIRE